MTITPKKGERVYASRHGPICVIRKTLKKTFSQIGRRGTGRGPIPPPLCTSANGDQRGKGGGEIPFTVWPTWKWGGSDPFFVHMNILPPPFARRPTVTNVERGGVQDPPPFPRRPVDENVCRCFRIAYQPTRTDSHAGQWGPKTHIGQRGPKPTSAKGDQNPRRPTGTRTPASQRETKPRRPTDTKTHVGHRGQKPTASNGYQNARRPTETKTHVGQRGPDPSSANGHRKHTSAKKDQCETRP